MVTMPFCKQNTILFKDIYVQCVCAPRMCIFVIVCLHAFFVYFALVHPYMSNGVGLCMIKRKWAHASLTRLLLLLVLVVMVAAEGHYVQVA